MREPSGLRKVVAGGQLADNSLLAIDVSLRILSSFESAATQGKVFKDGRHAAGFKGTLDQLYLAGERTKASSNAEQKQKWLGCHLVAENSPSQCC